MVPPSRPDRAEPTDGAAGHHRRRQVGEIPDHIALRQNRLVRGYYRRRPRHILDRLDAFSCGTWRHHLPSASGVGTAQFASASGRRNPPVVTLSTGLLRAGGPVAGQDAIQQAARADRELGEDLVQVVLHGTGTDEQLAAALRFYRTPRAIRAITAS